MMRRARSIVDVSTLTSSLEVASLLLWTGTLERPVLIPSMPAFLIAEEDPASLALWLSRIRSRFQIFPLRMNREYADSRARIGIGGSFKNRTAIAEDIRATVFLLKYGFENRLLQPLPKRHWYLRPRHSEVIRSAEDFRRWTHPRGRRPTFRRSEPILRGLRLLPLPEHEVRISPDRVLRLDRLGIESYEDKMSYEWYVNTWPYAIAWPVPVYSAKDDKLLKEERGLEGGAIVESWTRHFVAEDIALSRIEAIGFGAMTGESVLDFDGELLALTNSTLSLRNDFGDNPLVRLLKFDSAILSAGDIVKLLEGKVDLELASKIVEMENRRLSIEESFRSLKREPVEEIGLWFVRALPFGPVLEVGYKALKYAWRFLRFVKRKESLKTPE